MGVVVQNTPPNLLQLNKQFNRCYNDPSNGPTCPWLSMAGLTLTAILTVYHLNGSLLIGRRYGRLLCLFAHVLATHNEEHIHCRPSEVPAFGREGFLIILKPPEKACFWRRTHQVA